MRVPIVNVPPASLEVPPTDAAVPLTVSAPPAGAVTSRTKVIGVDRSGAFRWLTVLTLRAPGCVVLVAPNE